MVISPDGRHAISGSDDETICFWDLKTKQHSYSLERHENWISSVAISADGRIALSGSLDNTLRLWDLRTGKCLRILSGHEDWIRSVAISPDGRFALSGGHDKTLRLWDLRSGECLHVLRKHKDWISSVAFSPDGRYALSGSQDGVLHLWEFDWVFEFPIELEWGEGAAPYLENFLTLHTPYYADKMTRQGKPAWQEKEFIQLLTELSFRGYGWLKPAGVRRKLHALAAMWEDHEPDYNTLSVPISDEPANLAAMHCACCGQRFPLEDLNATSFCPDCQHNLRRLPEESEAGSWWKRLMNR